MNVTIHAADFLLTEAKIDEMRSHNQKENEVSESVFTSTIEKFINNVGLKLPYDSDPGFYKDHYDREVRARYNVGPKGKLFASDRLESSKTKDRSGKSDPDINSSLP